MEGQILILDAPLLRKVKKFPFAAALFAAVIMTVHLPPAFVFLWGIPDYLRIRPDQKIAVPALQLFSFAAIEYFIICPIICNPHNLSSSFLVLYALQYSYIH